jgi:glycosidase
LKFFVCYLYILFRYNPRYYFAIETSYGTTSDLKEMIDEMHKNGIRVILDGVRSYIKDSFIYHIYLGIQSFGLFITINTNRS